MPRFDGTGPRGMGLMTGQGLGNGVQPIGTGSGYATLNEPCSNMYRPSPRVSAPPVYTFHPFGITPYRARFWGGRGRGSWGRRHLFGPGRAFARKWW